LLKDLQKVSMKNVIVTGGAGFIGSCLVRMLCDKGVNVYVVDSLTYASELGNVDKRAVFYLADIRKPDCIKSYFKYKSDAKIDTLFHLAAETHVDNSIYNPSLFTETNVNGTVNLLNQCLNKGIRFIHVSTDEVYGDLKMGQDPFMENTPFNPSSPYSASKAASDHFVKAYHRTYGMDNIITHCSNNFGPRQNFEKLIPKVISRIIQNIPIPVYGNGSNVRDWIFVEDHCEALIYLSEHGKSGETYNIGANNELSNLELIDRIGKVIGKTYDIAFVEDRQGHDLRYAINTLKMEILGWKARSNFEEALKKTVEFYT